MNIYTNLDFQRSPDIFDRLIKMLVKLFTNIGNTPILDSQKNSGDIIPAIFVISPVCRLAVGLRYSVVLLECR